MALEKLEGCSDAYVDPKAGITLIFAKPADPDEKALQKMLAGYKIQVSGLKKVEKLPY